MGLWLSVHIAVLMSLTGRGKGNEHQAKRCNVTIARGAVLVTPRTLYHLATSVTQDSVKITHIKKRTVTGCVKLVIGRLGELKEKIKIKNQLKNLKKKCDNL